MNHCCGEGEKGFKVGRTHLKARITLINVFDRQINAFIKRYLSKQTLKIKINYNLPKGR